MLWKAYGTEMIRSAIDRDLDPSELLVDPIRAIAVHTLLEEKDIQFVYAGDNGDDSKGFDQHVLHHFVALHHAEQLIVLAIWGTLSLSGAIVDMQGMEGR
jgi:hypothetical protein